MTLHFQQSTWHSGEAAIQKLLHVPPTENPTAAGLPVRFAYRVVKSPLAAFGALDGEGRPWATVWGGEKGFAHPVGPQGSTMLSANTLADARHDPVLGCLLGSPEGDGQAGLPSLSDDANRHEYQITREELESGRGKMICGLGIDLATRDRVKFAGKLVAGQVENAREDEPTVEADPVARVHMAILVEESLGNCPKYLNKKEIRPHLPSPKLVSDSLPLPEEALELLRKADLFFLSSTNGEGMDINHRGGPPGFVRIISNNEEDGVSLCYPEYSGNRLYQTLGNMYVRPLIGMVIPDFETSDVLYLTGETKILVGADAARILTHTKLAVRIHVTSALFVKNGLPFRGDFIDYSPYNPTMRKLVAESNGDEIDPDYEPLATATLLNREIITPAIARFTFGVKPERPLKRWNPGQHVTFNFSSELDIGYSHMRDDDPRSLNDDFVRTFTISNPLPLNTGDEVNDEAKLEITVKKHGPATRLLWTHNLRVPLEVPVLGFGGEESFRMTSHNNQGTQPIFVAGGVGITPSLAQAPELIRSEKEFQLLWSLKGEDLRLAEDTFQRIPGIATRTRVFVTGNYGEEDHSMMNKLEEMGSRVSKGRMTPDVVLGDKKGARKFYLCTGAEMVKTLLKWLVGEDVVYETFEY